MPLHIFQIDIDKAALSKIYPLCLTKLVFFSMSILDHAS